MNNHISYRNFLQTFLVSLTVLSLQLLNAQTKDAGIKKNDLRSAHHEVFEGTYFPIDVSQMPKSPGYRFEGSSFFTIQVNTTDEGENIVGDAANEPSMAIDPTDPDKMVIGWRQFNTVNNSFRQAGYAYTLDGGNNWTFPGVIDSGVFRSDPVLAADANGTIFYNSLTLSGNNFWCDVYRMETGTTEWDEGTYALGGDKQWMTIDRTDGMGEGNIYASWTSFYSICYPDFFTRSTDGGDSYEDCVKVSGTPFWGTLATGSDGTLYATGYSDFGFILSRSVTAANPDWPVSWEPFTEVYLDGFISSGTGPNPGGLLGQTWVAVDNSDGPYSGNVYVLCSVERYSEDDPLDVMFARSTDGGLTFESPKRVNQDISTTNWQWFGTMSVAPDGRIDVVWLDTRDGTPGTYNSALYYAYSVDGGESFSDNEQVSDYFDPHLGWPQQDKMGDYFHMISDYDYAHLAWANTLNGEQDVYYTRINPWFVGVDENNENVSLGVSVAPNPVLNRVKVSYRSQIGNADITIRDLFSRVIYSKSVWSDKNRIESVEFDNLNLSDGIYFVNVEVNGIKNSTKLVVRN